MKEDKHHIKGGKDHPCPKCGSENTYFVDVVPEGFPDIDDVAIYCEDCKSEFV